MERKNNIRKPKSFGAAIKLIALLFLMSLMIGLLLTNEIKKEDEEKYVFSLIVFGVVTIIICIIIFVSLNSFFKAIYKINYLNNQIIFYTYNYVYVSQKKECTKIVKKRGRIVFQFSNGLELVVYTRILLFIKIKRIDETLIDKRNFPNTLILDKRKK